jgi:cytochrome c-type biogenesis protein CcmE
LDRKRITLLGVGGIAAVVIAITAFSIGDNLTYYFYPTEAVERRAEFSDGQRFRLAGLVKSGTLTGSAGSLEFTVTDGGAEIQVRHTGAVPPLFEECVPVLVEGSWEGDVFASDSAVIRHEENYEVPDEAGTLPSC